MALLMLDSGLRVGEVVQLRQTDLLYLDQPVTSVIITATAAKNNRERTVPLSARTIAALVKMHAAWWHDPAGAAAHYAFYTSNPCYRLSTRQVERIIRQAALAAFNRPVHPHILRHTFATRLMKVTSIRVVQALLGHTNIGSTQIYTHPDADDLQIAIDQLDH